MFGVIVVLGIMVLPLVYQIFTCILYSKKVGNSNLSILYAFTAASGWFMVGFALIMFMSFGMLIGLRINLYNPRQSIPPSPYVNRTSLHMSPMLPTSYQQVEYMTHVMFAPMQGRGESSGADLLVIALYLILFSTIFMYASCAGCPFCSLAYGILSCLTVHFTNQHYEKLQASSLNEPLVPADQQQADMQNVQIHYVQVPVQQQQQYTVTNAAPMQPQEQVAPIVFANAHVPNEQQVPFYPSVHAQDQ